MLNLIYTNNKNESINLSNTTIIKDASSIFARTWNAETSYNKIIGFSKKTTSYNITIDLIGSDAYNKANNILDVCEKDVILQKPGKLKCGEWYISGYILKSATSDYLRKSDKITLKLTFITDSNYWNKEDLYIYRIGDSGSGAERRGLGYEFDYPYDFLSPISSELLTNENFIESPAIITVYGPVINPKVIIGGHIYEVYITLSAQEYLVIDGYNKTITKIARNGIKTNVFANRNKTSYIFQKVPTGDNNVIIRPDCNVDIVLLNERGEPEWI